MVKGMIEAKKDSETLTPQPVPIYCEYASVQESQQDPFCELVGCTVAEVKTCPLEGNQDLLPAFADSARDTTMQMSLLNCKVDPDEIYITRIFGVTDRGRYHIMMRTRVTYCRGLADIVQIKHIETMPAAKVCKHCVYEYLKSPGAMLYLRSRLHMLIVYPQGS